MKKLYGIQYLRAAAALAVVLFHAAERSGLHFTIGAAGVDVFFVISGFIMWVISEAKPRSPGGFIRDRVVRIVPLYWMASAVMVMGGLFGLFPNLQLTMGHVLGSFFFVPHRSPSSGEVWPVLVQGWTLNYEMFFYMLFAASLFLPARWRLPVLTAVFLSLVGVGLLTKPQGALLATYTNSILIEFLFGMWAGKFWLANRIPPPGVGAALIAFSIAGFGLVHATGAGYHPFFLGPVALALVLGTLSLERAGRIPASRGLVYLGDASYSIYLWHTMANSVLFKLGSVAGLPSWSIAPFAVAAGVVLGIAAHEMLEKPLVGLLRGRRPPVPAPAPAA